MTAGKIRGAVARPIGSSKATVKLDLTLEAEVGYSVQSHALHVVVCHRNVTEPPLQPGRWFAHQKQRHCVVKPAAAAGSVEVRRCGWHFLEAHSRRVEVLSNHGRESVEAQFLSEPGVGELFGRTLTELSVESKLELRQG